MTTQTSTETNPATKPAPRPAKAPRTIVLGATVGDRIEQFREIIKDVRDLMTLAWSPQLRAPKDQGKVEPSEVSAYLTVADLRVFLGITPEKPASEELANAIATVASARSSDFNVRPTFAVLHPAAAILFEALKERQKAEFATALALLKVEQKEVEGMGPGRLDKYIEGQYLEMYTATRRYRNDACGVVNRYNDLAETAESSHTLELPKAIPEGLKLEDVAEAYAYWKRELGQLNESLAKRLRLVAQRKAARPGRPVRQGRRRDERDLEPTGT